MSSVTGKLSELAHILLSGKSDVLPEDVGGTSSFADFLEVIADTQYEDYEHMKSWSELQRWKPFHFDLAAKMIRQMC